MAREDSRKQLIAGAGLEDKEIDGLPENYWRK